MSEKKMDVPFGRPWITDEDRAAVARVLDGPILTHGPACHDFEEAFSAFTGGGRSVTLSSCTAGMHLFYMHLGVGSGDEIILPGISHVATVHAVEVTGARPIFVDVDPATGNIDPDGIEAALTQRTRAISLVHFLGIPASMGRIMEIAGRHGLPVLEDCAVALGTTWNGTHAGLFGDAGCFSFYPAKHITSAEGGMLLARNPEVAESIRRIRGFCYDRSLNDRKLPGIYDIDGLGLNYRMSELQAALGASQLERAGTILDIRRRNFTALKTRLSELDDLHVLDCVDPEAVNSHYTLSVVLGGKAAARRDDALLMLKERGVGTSVHYPHPLPRLKYYREKYGYEAESFTGAAGIADHSLNLPVGPHMDEAAINYIADNFIEVFRNIAK